MGKILFGKIATTLRWVRIQPEIKNIKQIHCCVSRQGKMIDKSDWPEKKELRSSYESSKDIYESYLDFCDKKDVRMTRKQEELEQMFYETEVALYGEKDALMKEYDRAIKTLDVESKIFSEVGMKLHKVRSESVHTIEKVEKLINGIAKSSKFFDKEYEEIQGNKENFKSAVEFAKEQEKIVVDSVKKSAKEAAASALVAKGAPKAIVWVATTFGKSSAGTAISALSGAAKTNAALAWLGGGAVAAGGGGMAAGTALLGLITTVGNGFAMASVAVGVIKLIIKKIHVEENKRKEIENIKQKTLGVREAACQALALIEKTKALTRTTAKLRKQCDKLKRKEYTSLSKDEKELLGALVNNTKTLSRLLLEVIE